MSKRFELAFQWGLLPQQFEPCLTLPLLILRFFLVDDTQAAFTAYQLVIGTDFLYARTNFHELLEILSVKINLAGGS